MKEDIIVFGIGQRAEEDLDLISAKGVSVKYYVDNDDQKIGKKYRGSIIKAPRELIGEYNCNTIVICSRKYKEEIIEQLIDYGIYYQKKCFFIDDYLYRLYVLDYQCSPIENTSENKNNISVLYDSQIFSMQEIGGVSRYFYELINEVSKKGDISVNLFRGVNICKYRFEDIDARCFNLYTKNTYIKNYELKNAINATIIREYVKCKDKFTIYHPTYYAEYGVENYRYLIVTVHDMIHELFHLDKKTILMKKRMIDKADGIIAVSQNTKNDLMNIYNIPEYKIKVIYHGISLYKEPGETPYIKEPYILYVGNRFGYKNADMLIKAFGKSRCKKEYKLVFMGGENFTDTEKELFASMEISEKVVHCHGGDALLANLYKYADFFVYPTEYEGFGFPIIEAMHYGTPVITSNQSSMKEIAGEAAFLLETYSEECLIHAMEYMMDNDECKREYSIRGYKREKDFSWEKCTNETVDYYKSFM